MLTAEELLPIKLTLELALITTVFLLLVATPLAWWLSHTKSKWRAPISSIVTLPLVLPPSVLGFYLLVAMGPSGPLGKLTEALGIGLLTFTFPGLVIGSIVYSMPFAVQPLQAAFESIGKRPLEVAATLGAKPLDAFFNVVLPLAKPGFVTAALLTFAHTIGEFGVVLMIGGNVPGKTQVVSTEIYSYVEAMEYGKAHWLAGGMVVFSFFVLLGLTLLNRHNERVMPYFSRLLICMSDSLSSASLLLPREDGFRLECSFEFPNFGITVLFGASGSGKTTVLRCIAGLERAKGFVKVDGVYWQNDEQKLFLPTWERPLGYVFQEASLFPHLTAKQNIEFAVKRSKSTDARSRMEEAIDLLGIRGLLGRKPAQLSGGERQRVAIARAVATEPKIMLFDEPLAALDFKRKSEIMPWLEKLKTNLKIPMLYVTHSAEEVLHLADNLIVMEDGRIKTSGALTDVLANIDLPIKIGEDTGVLLKGKIVSKDKEWSLMTVDCGNIALHIGDNGQPIGSPASLRILAREVVFAKEQPSGLSVQNAFEGVVEEISVQKDSSGALIRANCSGQIIVGKLTRKALSELDIKEGSQIWLLIKSVALLSV